MKDHMRRAQYKFRDHPHFCKVNLNLKTQMNHQKRSLHLIQDSLIRNLRQKRWKSMERRDHFLMQQKMILTSLPKSQKKSFYLQRRHSSELMLWFKKCFTRKDKMNRKITSISRKKNSFDKQSNWVKRKPKRSVRIKSKACRKRVYSN